MSRTDAHAPLWVALMRRDLTALPVHDHRSGDCDLVPLTQPPDSTASCRWEFSYTGTAICACELCSATRQRRRDRRQDRRKVRRLLRSGVEL